jgi:predicted metal-binding membrane protein
VNDLVSDRALAHLGPAETHLAAILGRPKSVAVTCVVLLAALGWGACALLPSDPATAWSDAFCRPALGRGSLVDAALVLAMWTAMTLARMLPTAGPMILTYAEIADTAARKSEPVVSPIVLTAGYASVWLGFAATAALLQMLLASLTTAAILRAPLAGAIFFTAGLYQFSSLKLACLAHCQRPFPFLFANWTTQTRGVFALGLRQGLYCLGCCWALMLLMFAVGAMNVLWMAALGVLMTIEKMSTTARFSRALGVAMIAVGIALLAREFM